MSKIGTTTITKNGIVKNYEILSNNDEEIILKKVSNEDIENTGNNLNELSDSNTSPEIENNSNDNQMIEYKQPNTGGKRRRTKAKKAKKAKTAKKAKKALKK